MPWTLVLLLVWVAAIAGALTLGDDPTRNTVRVALAFYAVAAWIMLGLRRADWRVETSRSRLVLYFWTLAWAAFLIHVATAFHFDHHWSHAEAVRHVLERSGVGEGIYVSYLFTLFWTVDVFWWCLGPTTYAARPPWIDHCLHGFMVLMIFFATVVYEEGPIRWAGLVLCGALALRWFWRAGSRERPEDLHCR